VATFLAPPFCAFTFTMWEHSMFPNTRTCGNIMCFPINMGKYVPKRGLVLPHMDVSS